MESSTLENTIKGSLLFVGAYFVCRSLQRLYTTTSEAEVKHQACTLGMGAVGAGVICAVAHTL